MPHLYPARRAVILGGGAAFASALGAQPATGQAFSDGYTFIQAVRNRDGAKIQELLSRPAHSLINVRARDTGDGALHILAEGQDVPWLSFFLGRGANPDLQNGRGDTPLLLCAGNGWLEGAELLLGARANPNRANFQGTTPLIPSVVRRDTGMVELLLSKGADPNQTDHENGKSAIDYAREDPRAPTILKRLLAAPTP